MPMWANQALSEVKTAPRLKMAMPISELGAVKEASSAFGERLVP